VRLVRYLKRKAMDLSQDKLQNDDDRMASQWQVNGKPKASQRQAKGKPKASQRQASEN